MSKLPQLAGRNAHGKSSSGPARHRHLEEARKIRLGDEYSPARAAYEQYLCWMGYMEQCWWMAGIPLAALQDDTARTRAPGGRACRLTMLLSLHPRDR
jgi:hypothetical protein